MNSWSDTSSSEKELIDQFASFYLLVIDKYGLHEKHLEMLHQVLDSSYDNMKSTLLIPNFKVQKMSGISKFSKIYHNRSYGIFNRF